MSGPLGPFLGLDIGTQLATGRLSYGQAVQALSRVGRSTPEERYPAFLGLIERVRKARPDLTDLEINAAFAAAERAVKANPGDLSEAEIDAHVLGRGRGIVERIFSGFGRASGLEQLGRLTGITPEEKAYQEAAREVGGLPYFAGQVIGATPAVVGVTGAVRALPILATRPNLAAWLGGGGVGAALPLLEGEAPTATGIAANAILGRLLGGRHVSAPRRTAPPTSVEPPLGPKWPEGAPPIQGTLAEGIAPPIEGIPAPIPSIPPPVEGIPYPTVPLIGRFQPPPLPLVSGITATPGVLPPTPIVGQAAAPVAGSLAERVRFKQELAEALGGVGVKPSDLVQAVSRNAQAALQAPTFAQADVTVKGLVRAVARGTTKGPRLRLNLVGGRAEELTEEAARAKLKRQIAEVDAWKKLVGEAASGEDVNWFGDEGEALTSLHMGFNPFQAARSAKELWGVLRRPAGPQEAELLRQLPRSVMFARWRLPEVLFRKMGGVGERFWGGIQRFMGSYEPELIRYENLWDDIVRPIRRSPALLQELMEALNTEEGYRAASPLVRGVADRTRNEILDPLFHLLQASQRALGRQEPRYMPFYYRHVLERRETWRWLNNSLRDAEAAGDVELATLLTRLRAEFGLRGNNALVADEEFREIARMGMRDIFRDVPPSEAGFGALERRLLNLPTFRREPLLVIEGYIRGALRKAYLDPLLPELALLSKQMSSPMQLRATIFLRDLLGIRHPQSVAFEDQMRRLGLWAHHASGGRFSPSSAQDLFDAEQLSRIFRQAEYWRTLYGNVGGALVNATQLVLNGYPLLSQEFGHAKAAELIVRGLVLSLNPEGRALARQMGAFRAKGAAGLEGRPRMMETFAGWGDLFGLAETGFLRPVSGLAKYLGEVERGASHDQAIRAGIQFIRKTQFQIDPTTLPEIARGPLGRALYQFQSFKQQELNFFLRTLDARGKATFGGVLLALGGISALPFGLGQWLHQLAASQGLAPLATGIPGLAGIDLARRISPVEPFAGAITQEQLTSRGVQAFSGPVLALGTSLFGVLTRLATLARPTLGGQLAPTAFGSQLLEPVLRELEPIAAQRLALGAEVAQTGQLRAGQPSALVAGARALGVEPPAVLPRRFGGAGVLLARGTTQVPPLISALTGLPLAERTQLDIAATTEQQLREAHRVQRDRILEAYIYFKQTGDSGPLLQAAREAPGIDVRAVLRYAESPALERFRRLTPRRFRPAFQQALEGF